MSENRERFREIVNTFARYGFGELYQRSLGQRDPEESARKLRQSFEALGPSFVKIGQTLATRNDLLPEIYIKELKKLHTASFALSFEEMDAVFQDEIGASMEESFDYVDRKALATGSIAQVYYAIDKTGKSLAIKIQRPHIKAEMIRDLNLFMRFINLIPNVFQDIIVDPIDIIKEMRRQTMRELNFYEEAEAMLKFTQLNQDRTLLKVPHIYLDYCTQRVLTQEEIPGLSFTDKEALAAAGYDLGEIAEKIVMASLYQVFEDGYYHADPHPGNLMVSDGKIYYIDFGIMGEVQAHHRQFLISLLKALVTKDIGSLTEIMVMISNTKGYIDEAGLYQELNQLYNRYLTAGFWTIDLNNMFQDAMRVAHKYNISLPHELVLLIKTTILVQGMAQDFHPEMDYMALFTSFAAQSDAFNIKDLFDFKKIQRRLAQSVIAGVDVPRKLNLFLENANNERLTVNLAFRNTDKRLREVNQIVNRVIIAILLSAIIISSGMIASFNQSSNISRLGLTFFIIGVVFAIYLLFSFIRSRRNQ